MSHWYRCITICMGVLQRGHPLPMADTVFAQGEQKQTLTNNQSCQRKRDAVLHCATLYSTADNAVAPARWSFKIQSRIFRSSIFQPSKMVLHFPVLLFPVLHFQRPRITQSPFFNRTYIGWAECGDRFRKRFFTF